MNRISLSPSEEAALADVASHRPLVALDFDGTLAPIVDDPDEARVPDATASLLRSLAELCRVAVVTGRQIEDARPRLGFRPWRIVGSHGAQCSHQPALAADLANALEEFRSRLQLASANLLAAGVAIEDKRQSICLHYRRAPDQCRALSAIRTFLSGSVGDVHVFGGKQVVNVTSALAPNKAHAVQSLLAQSGAAAVFYAGDDVNDEPVFRSAAPNWLTVQVGRVEATEARMTVDDPVALAGLLRRLLDLLT